MNSTHTQLHGRTVGSDDRRRWIKRKPANEIDEQRHEPAHQGRPHVRAVDSAGIVVRFVQQRDSLAQRNTDLIVWAQAKKLIKMSPGAPFQIIFK